jgi:NAD(P)H-dependent FMN reductase
MTDKSAQPKLGIIIGSTRPGRVGEDVARWVAEIARQRTDAEFELVDLKAFDLPLLDEPVPASMARYAKAHTRAWSERIAGLDGFVFVTPEYNHSVPGALKNAIDYLHGEWNNKAAGFVSYGSAGGVRAVEHLRTILAELQVATVRSQAALFLSTDFVEYRTFRPDPMRAKAVGAMLDQLVSWSTALRAVRAPAAA